MNFKTFFNVRDRNCNEKTILITEDLQKGRRGKREGEQRENFFKKTQDNIF